MRRECDPATVDPPTALVLRSRWPPRSPTSIGPAALGRAQGGGCGRCRHSQPGKPSRAEPSRSGAGGGKAQRTESRRAARDAACTRVPRLSPPPRRWRALSWCGCISTCVCMCWLPVCRVSAPAGCIRLPAKRSQLASPYVRNYRDAPPDIRETAGQRCSRATPALQPLHERERETPPTCVLYVHTEFGGARSGTEIHTQSSRMSVWMHALHTYIHNTHTYYIPTYTHSLVPAGACRRREGTRERREKKEQRRGSVRLARYISRVDACCRTGGSVWKVRWRRESDAR